MIYFFYLVQLTTFVTILPAQRVAKWRRKGNQLACLGLILSCYYIWKTPLIAEPYLYFCLDVLIIIINIYLERKND